MKIAVVIPARNAEPWIDKCVKSINAGSRLPDELVVVDGCSHDATKSICIRNGVNVLDNPRRDAGKGRQIGLESCSSEIVAFTDADCIVPHDWLTKIESRFIEYPELEGLGGKIYLGEAKNAIQRYCAKTFEEIMHFPVQFYWVTSREMRGSFPEANCAYLRTLLLSEKWDNFYFANHAEGIDLSWRLIANDRKLLFDPAIQVEHLGYPDTLKKLIITHFNYGIASTKLAKVHIRKNRIDPLLYINLFQSISGLISFTGKKEEALAQFAQLASFLSGKYWSSLRYGIINF